ncbi:MAG: SH3 domain-containing protein [Oscillatoriales cyanobacterium]|nr:MAG: SH3 domain-containing protein [Oscillatoriales cyanobacterium]
MVYKLFRLCLICCAITFLTNTNQSWAVELDEANNTGCPVLLVDIQSGQLAVRMTPGGRMIAGLSNYNVVQFIRQQGAWYYVEITNASNPRLNGTRGWVHSKYLECGWD